jgi:hypothetical protein
LNFTRKTDIARIANTYILCDIGFSSEIQRGIPESANEFSLNRIAFYDGKILNLLKFVSEKLNWLTASLSTRNSTKHRSHR